MNKVISILTVCIILSCGRNDPAPSSESKNWTGTKSIKQAGSCATADTNPFSVSAITIQNGSNSSIKTTGTNAIHSLQGTICGAEFTVTRTSYGSCNGVDRTYKTEFQGTLSGNNFYMVGVDTVYPNYNCLFEEKFDLMLR